jgi:hypothetical protein
MGGAKPEEMGHEVVADPNFAAMYATRSRRVKTDKRDARTLAEASRLGAYRRAHRISDERRHLRLGDFGLEPLGAAQRKELLEVLDDRYQVSSTAGDRLARNQ